MCVQLFDAISEELGEAVRGSVGGRQRRPDEQRGGQRGASCCSQRCRRRITLCACSSSQSTTTSQSLWRPSSSCRRAAKRRKWRRVALSINMVITPYFQAYHALFSRNRFQNDTADADEANANADGARDAKVTMQMPMPTASSRTSTRSSQSGTVKIWVQFVFALNQKVDSETAARLHRQGVRAVLGSRVACAHAAALPFLARLLAK